MIKNSNNKPDEIHENSSHHIYQNISDLPPLHISKQTQNRINHIKATNAISEFCYLRVKSIANGNIIDFNLVFDDKIGVQDRIYRTKSVLFLLDNETAYLLIGSELKLDKEQEFEFIHQEFELIDLNIDDDGNKIFN
ncbi:MAG: hypothetical protein HOK65_14585 [Crocinitomicaceae bacterium]|jgi:hypothetical protein|nr:hypothetical protein [Crocinitomicaceae bacterium]MBT7358100.1 hypothetical protein [Candidatus Neomarinimicrobiota bacterium]